MGQLTISKSGEVFATVQENDGLYQPVYEVQSLPGAVYDLIADEDIYTGDGTLRVEKDTVVETLKTGKDGTAKSNMLFLGKYRLEEKTAPNGCVISTEPEYVELTYAGETVKINKVSAGLYDERQKASVELRKAIETDKTFGIEDKEVYKDITFGIYAATELKAVDGTIIPKDGLLEITPVIEGGEGTFGATFATDLPLGSYYVKEHTANEAFSTCMWTAMPTANLTLTTSCSVSSPRYTTVIIQRTICWRAAILSGNRKRRRATSWTRTLTTLRLPRTVRLPLLRTAKRDAALPTRHSAVI